MCHSLETDCSCLKEEEKITKPQNQSTNYMENLLIVIFNKKTLLVVKFQLEIEIKQNHPKLINIGMKNGLQIVPLSLLEYDDKNGFRN